MKGYQKLTIITAALGLIIPIIGLSLYFLINSIIGIPLLALFVGAALAIAVLIVAINVGAVVAVFKISNKNVVGGILIGCGVILFIVIQYFAIPAMILFIIAGIMAFRDKEKITFNNSGNNSSNVEVKS